MGITGLIKFVQDAQRSGNLSSYRGKVVAIDGYIWLHKAVSTCVHELAYGVPTTKYVTYCMKRVKHLLDYGIIPIIVFDGAPLPMKAETENLRRKRREERRKVVIEMIKKKKKSVPRDLLIGCINVTYEMVHNWIVELRSMGIRYIVAPYEADPQLAYLCLKNITSAVISEDSDLLVFKCKEVLFKLDIDSTFTRIKYEDIFKIPAMKHMNADKFIEMCILSGCDYLSSPKRVGIKSAYNFLKTLTATQLLDLWDHNPDDPKVPERCPDYNKKFQAAKFAFYHQLVYDDETNQVVNLNPLGPNNIPHEFDMFEIIGVKLDCKIAEGIAKGFLNPLTHEPFAHNVKIPAQIKIDDEITTKSHKTNKILCKKYTSFPNPLQVVKVAPEQCSPNKTSLLVTRKTTICGADILTHSQTTDSKNSFFLKLSQSKSDYTTVSQDHSNTVLGSKSSTFNISSNVNSNGIDHSFESDSKLSNIDYRLTKMQFSRENPNLEDVATTPIIKRNISNSKKIQKTILPYTFKRKHTSHNDYEKLDDSETTPNNLSCEPNHDSTLISNEKLGPITTNYFSSIDTDVDCQRFSDPSQSSVKRFAQFCSMFLEKSSRHSS